MSELYAVGYGNMPIDRIVDALQARPNSVLVGVTLH